MSKKKGRVWPWLLVILLLMAGIGWFGRSFFMDKAKEVATEKAKTYKVDKVILSTFLFKHGEWITSGTIYLNQPLPGPNLVNLGKVTVHAMLERRLKLPILLEPRADLSTIEFHTHVSAVKYIELVRTLQKHDSLDITLNAAIPFDLPVVGKEVVYIKNQKLRVPTFKVPIVTVGNLGFDKMGLKHSKAHLPVTFKNLEKATLRVSDMHLKVQIGDVGDLDVKQDRKLTLGPFAKDSVELMGVLDLEKPFGTALNILRNKDKYTALIQGKIDVVVLIHGTEVIVPYRINEKEGIELMPSKKKIEEIKEMKFDKK